MLTAGSEHRNLSEEFDLGDLWAVDLWNLVVLSVLLPPVELKERMPFLIWICHLPYGV